jgi:hypothetical protein
MSSSSAELPTPEGPGSISGAPNLPAGFTNKFTSRYVDTGALRVHAVVGGEGPPLLLVHRWHATGHWVAEDAPEEMLAALTSFLAAYREGAPAPAASAVR